MNFSFVRLYKRTINGNYSILLKNMFLPTSVQHINLVFFELWQYQLNGLETTFPHRSQCKAILLCVHVNNKFNTLHLYYQRFYCIIQFLYRAYL